MENTLKQLQEYQIDALRKSISFDLNTYVLNESTEFTVKLSYAEANATLRDTRTFCTTFSNMVEDKSDAMKMGRIRKFINNVNKE